MKLYCLLLLFVANSCDFVVPDYATIEQKERLIAEAQFDTIIIKNLTKYNALQSFLERNIDTIIKARFLKNTHISVGDHGQPDSQYLADDDCYHFFQGNSRYDVSNFPDFVKDSIDSFVQSFTNSELYSFEVCKSKQIQIQIRNDSYDNGLFISHVLLWNSKVDRDPRYEENKDSVVSEKCIYRIGLKEYHGH